MSLRKLALQRADLAIVDGTSDKRRSKTWPRLRSFVHFPVRKAKGIKLRGSSVNAAMQPPSGDQRADWQTHQLDGLHLLFQQRVKSITYSLEIDLRCSCLGGFLPRSYHKFVTYQTSTITVTIPVWGSGLKRSRCPHLSQYEGEGSPCSFINM